MKRSLSIIIFMGAVLPVLTARNPVLDAYISEGLKSNQGLKQQQLEYTRDLMALREARGLFFPDININARYTVASGGRVIDFPVGDLLNPVYSTLNMLTASDNFPQIENESFNFYRPREQETKVSLVQPLFSSDLIYNVRIKSDAAEISRIDINRYKKELILEITRAYYNYQKAYYLLNLADTTRILVKENVRVSQRLYENDKVTIDAVYRSEAEEAGIEAEQARARNLVASSKAYFNFLLNRQLDREITLVTETPLPASLSLENAQEKAIENREELDQIRRYQAINQQLVNRYRAKNAPQVFGMVDYGFQGTKYSFTGEDDFILASLVLKWDLFNGLTNHAKVQQSIIEGEKLEAVYDQSVEKIRLDVIHRYYALSAAYESLQAAGKQKRSATSAYRLINRKYSEGQASLLELIDARTRMTKASSNLIMAGNEYFISMAELEHATGTVDLTRY